MSVFKCNDKSAEAREKTCQNRIGIIWDSPESPKCRLICKITARAESLGLSYGKYTASSQYEYDKLRGMFNVK